MKGKLSILFLSISVLTLQACSLNKKPDNPEEIIKKTQVNVIKSFKAELLSKQNVEFKSDISINAKTPYGGANILLSLNGKTLFYTWEDINLGLNGEFDIKFPQVITGKVDLDLSLKATLSKLYFKLTKLNLSSSDPQITMYAATTAKMIKNKWIYIENKGVDVDLINSYRNLELESVFVNNPIFKFNEKISNNKFKVSLNKDSLVNIVYNIGKQLDPNFTKNKEELKKEFSSGDVIGELEVWNNKYFTFSGYIQGPTSKKLKLNISFKKDKFLISLLDLFTIDLDRNGDSFNGNVSFKNGPTEELSIPLSGKLNSKDFNLKLSYNKDGINVNISLTNSILGEIKDLNINLPSDAVSLEDSLKYLLGGFGVGGLPTGK